MAHLLDDDRWHGRIYSGGWTDGAGEEITSVEPATGEQLGRVGSATAADVHKAERAAQAQVEWAAGLSLGVLARDVAAGIALAERIPGGLLHTTTRPSTTRPPSRSAEYATRETVPATAARPPT
jgi:Aldehyde dehydrogenase family